MRETESTNRKRLTAAIIIAGALARVIVWLLMVPVNNDRHMDVVAYVAEHGRPPAAGMLEQAYHPPLYYLVVAPVWRSVGSLKSVQAFSLVCSLGTLWLLHRLLVLTLTGAMARWRPWCLALAAVHPNLILYSLFISNDAPAIALGAGLLLAMAWTERDDPAAGRWVVAVVLGLGLSTKSTFLAYVPVVAAFLWLAGQGRHGTGRRVVELGALMLMACAIGGWRYMDNALRYGNPFLSNLDFSFGWIEGQKGTWIGPATLLDFNLLKLVRDPVVSPGTRHSFPLMLYGSFWYRYIVEPTFRGNTGAGIWLGRLVVAAGVVPTLAMLAGCVRGWMDRGGGGLMRRAAIACLVLNVVLLVWAGLKYDVWSILQGRLMFPAYGGALLVLAHGMEAAWGRRAVDRVVRVALAVLLAVMTADLLLEIVLLPGEMIGGGAGQVSGH